LMVAIVPRLRQAAQRSAAGLVARSDVRRRGEEESLAMRLFSVCIDARDPKTLAQFWADALGQRVVAEEIDEVMVGVDERSTPGLCFLLVPEPKAIKNRLHLDLAPDDQDAEVERLVGLGATRVDVGQPPDAPWVVLADPEGNEFCVLEPRRSLVD